MFLCEALLVEIWYQKLTALEYEEKARKVVAFFQPVKNGTAVCKPGR